MDVLGDVFLLRRFAIGARPSIASLSRRFALMRVRRCVSVAALCHWLAPGDVVLSRRFALMRVRRCGSGGALTLGSRLLFAAWRQTGRLAICFVSIPPGRDRHLCVLDASARLSAFVGSLRVWAFLAGDLDGVPGTGLPGTRGTGLAAPRLYAFAQPHWPCESFRGEYAGATRPRLRQRVFDSLDSLHAAAGLCWYVFTAFVRLCAIALALRIFPRGVRWG